MAELCAFCGKKLTLFVIDTLTCGDVSQPACADCAEKYVRVSQIERCRGLLNGEWAREPERVRTFLERAEKRKRELEEWREKASRCPACGAKMELKLKDFSIGADGHGGLSSLFLEQYDVDLYACPNCGKVELYTAGFQKPEEKPAEETTEPVEKPEPAELRSGGFLGLGRRKETRPPWEK